LWAELSEKLSDLINADIKYGGGDPDALDNLSAAAEEILKVEDDEQSLDRVRAELARRGVMSEDMGRTMLLAQQRIAERRKKVLTLIADMGDVGPED
jgi:hypothetical protein